MTGESLDRALGRPLYLQLADRLLEQIRQSTWKQGEDLPSLGDLASCFEVRPNVVERSLEKLRREGWICWNGRAGAWTVSEPREVEGVLLGWDPAHMRLEGVVSPEVRVLAKTLTTLSKDQLQVFEVHGKDGNRANRISKLYLSEGQPMALETILSPVSTLPGLLMKDHRHENLFRMIEKHYGISVMRVIQQTHVRVLSREEADWLRSAEEFPALCIDRTLFDEREPVALSQWVLPGGRCAWMEEGIRVP